jgi:phosphoadenosine phosphosulfate reductase
MNAVSLYARPSAGYTEKLAATVALLQDAAAAHAGAIVQATSLGAEDMVLTDLIAQHAIRIELATLDTGALHESTLALVPRIHERYGLEIQVFKPASTAVVAFVARHGELAMRQSIELRKACCQLRKLEPLSRLLEGRSAWVTGLRREQSDARADVPASEPDGHGRIKFNPLADWTWGDVWHHVATNEVPYNPLHDQFHPSIGCAPCTRAIAVGEDFRSGRWWWENDSAKECGLHVSVNNKESNEKATA